MSSGFNGLNAYLVPYATALLSYAQQRGFRPTVTSVYRSRAVQARLYQRYLAGLSPWPAAPPGQSMHEYGWAFDLVVGAGGKSAEQTELGRVWESWGGRWGGRFNDDVHFEGPR